MDPHLPPPSSLGGAGRFRNRDVKLSETQSFLQQFQQLDKILEKTPYIAERCIRRVELRFGSYEAVPMTHDEKTNFMLGKVLARLVQVQEFELSLERWTSYPREAKHIIYAEIRQPSVSRLSIDSNYHFLYCKYN